MDKSTPEIVVVSGNRVNWPRLCVSCCDKRRLKKRPLRIAAMESGIYDDELEEVDPAYATVSWEFSICRNCLRTEVPAKTPWRYVDIACIVMPILSGGAAALGFLDWMLPLSLTLLGLFYSIPRVVSRYVQSRRVRRKNKPLAGGSYLRCKMIYDRYGREILGFDSFLELMRRGEVTCEFEFANPSYADEFRKRNRIFKKPVFES